MKSLAPAVALLAASLAWAGSFSGASVVWHDLRAKRPPVTIEKSIAEHAAALETEPLSRRSRIALAGAVDEAIAQRGVDRVVEIAPQGMLGRAVTAAVIERYGYTEKAAALRATIRSARPEEMELSSPLELRAIGIAAASADHCREALPFLEAAVRERLDDWSLLMKRAACLTEAGDANRALEALLPMYEKSSSSRWVRLLLAQTEARLGQYDTAVALTRTLIATDPDFYEMWRFAGDLMAVMKRPALASQSYRRALALRPENTWIKNEIWKQDRLWRESKRAAPSGDAAP